MMILKLVLHFKLRPTFTHMHEALFGQWPFLILTLSLWLIYRCSFNCLKYTTNFSKE